MTRVEEQYRGNDIYDIWHAAIAMPYCDYVLTEKKLSNVLNNTQDIRTGSYYRAEVCYSLVDVIEKLRLIP